MPGAKHSVSVEEVYVANDGPKGVNVQFRLSSPVTVRWYTNEGPTGSPEMRKHVTSQEWAVLGFGPNSWVMELGEFPVVLSEFANHESETAVTMRYGTPEDAFLAFTMSIVDVTDEDRKT